MLARAGRTLGEAIAGAFVAALVAAIGLYAFSLVQWPAFNSSNVTRSITTVGQLVALAGIAASVVLYRIHKLGWLAKLLSWVSLSTFVTVTLGMPLAATKLYLLGISVDQEFRTEYLTRLTDSSTLRDMTYADTAPYYPAGWFWVGGRVANALGLAGWEVFKPYAIGSLAVAAVIGCVLWSKLIRNDWAVVVSAATAAVVLAYASPEPYSAIITLLIAPALILAWGALHRPSGLGWAAAVGTGLFLGLAATFYTLYLGLAAFVVTLMALIAAALAVKQQRAWRAVVPVGLKLIAIAAIAGIVALTVWLPYLLSVRSGTTASTGTALHYLPESGSALPLPMLAFTLSGALCMFGTLWLIVRAGSSRRAQALGIGVLGVYLWYVLSMVATVVGTTLLAFRLEPILVVLLSVAGFFGVVEGARALYQVLNEPGKFKIATVAVGLIAALAFSQDIPHTLVNEINVAYTDTDGNGVRADKRPPSAVAYYADVDKVIAQQTSRPRDDTVVLTADTSFLSYYPYYGFQALTSHYANPLAQFDQRAAKIADWSKLTSPTDLVDALNTSPWRAPDAFLFRRSADGFTLRLAADVYPNDPNVRRYTVTFPEKLFQDPRFTITDIGPFALVTRK